MPGRLRLIGFAAVALAAAGTVAAVSAQASPVPASRIKFGVRLFDVPADAANNPRALRYIVDFVPTGTVFHRRILIVNQESRAGRFTVYPDAAMITGGQFVGLAGATRSELTSWITVQRPVLRLGPGERALDRITIRVPEAATRGEHYAVIWVQQAGGTQIVNGVNIKVVARVGIRVYLAVGKGGAPPTKFVITSLAGRRSARGLPELVAHVRNTGGRAVDLSGQARLSGGPGGTSAGPFGERQAVTLAPGQSGSVTFAPRRALPPGPWRAAVTLVSGFTIATAHATVLFSNEAATQSLAGWATLFWGGGGLLGCALALAAVVLIWRRPWRARGVHA